MYLIKMLFDVVYTASGYYNDVISRILDCGYWIIL